MGTILADVTLLGKDSTYPGIPNADIHGQLVEERLALLFVPSKGWSFRPHQMLNSVRYQEGYQPLVIPWEHLRDWAGDYTSTSMNNFAFAIIGLLFIDPQYRIETSVEFKVAPFAGFGAKNTAVEMLRRITDAYGRWYRDLSTVTNPR